ncbi:MAG: choice-of-anchor L domain-containing protein [Cyanobacteriota bacterium]|nr:choice-of-anchor L domain-containing protein [Cyanobacteriota bacterium]
MASFTVFDPLTGSLATLVNALLATHSGMVVDNGSIQLRLSGPGAVSQYDTAVGSPLGISAGLLLTSGTTPGTSNTSTWYGSDNSGGSGFANGDADIDAVVNTVFHTVSFDATTLAFSFTVIDPKATSVSFDLVFGSDEYPEWVDAFVDCGIVIVDGVNYALFNNDPLHPLSVISPNLNGGYFQDNAGNVLPIEYDGVSGRLRILAPLKAGQTSHSIKIGVADTGDHILDSGLFIANLSAGTDPGSGVVANPGGGTGGNDNCTGSGKDEYFDLQAGDDTVYAGAGNDIIVAGSGNDKLFGGSGNDNLKGDSGDDLLDGGADLDTAVYGGGSGAYGFSYDALTQQFTIDGTAQGEGLDVLVGVERVTFADGLFSLTTAGFSPVAAPPPPATNLPGSVVITGLAAVGKTLQATVMDADGLPSAAGAILYQWTADGVAIAGATGASYVVQGTDVGLTLGVEAVYTDAKGRAEQAIANGVFVLPPSDGDLTVTLMAIEGPLVAHVHTSITTLLERAVELGETPASATQKIRSALNVPTTTPNLLNTNAFQILSTGVGDTAMALSLAKLQVQVQVICSLNDDQSGAKLALALLNKAASGGNFDLTKATDLCTILDLDPSAFNLADKTTYPQPLKEIIDRTSNIKSATRLFGPTDAKSIEHEWLDFLSNWDSLADGVPLSSLSLAINQGPTGFATAQLPAVAAGDLFTLSGAQLIAGISDPDNDPLTVSWLTSDHGDWFSANGDGSWSLDPHAAGYDPAYVGPLELTYTVEDGQNHSLTANQLLLVVDHINQAPTGSVTISGLASLGQALLAAHTLADGDGLGAISWQWRANGAPISGATAASYVVQSAELGKTISVTASYVDAWGTAEAVTSAATSAVNLESTPPTVLDVGVEGAVVSLRFSEPISASAVPASLFSLALVSASGSVTTPAISSIAVSGADPTRLLISLASAPASSLDVRVGYIDPAGNQTNAVVEDLAGNDLASFANQFATSFSSAATVSTLASLYTNLTLTGGATIKGTGNANANRITGNGAANQLSGASGNDTLIGGAGADTLIGGLGADVLTGGMGGAGDTAIDIFKLASLSESPLAGLDRLTDLVIGSDKIDGPSSVSAANLKDGLGPVTALSEGAIQAVLTPTLFVALGAATFTLGSGASARTFLALNDSTAGYAATTDGIVEITGYSGSLATLAVV